VSDGFLTGSALQNATDRMVEMGFDPERVREALRASFNNAERAVEYLMDVGILLFTSVALCKRSSAGSTT